MNHYKSWSGLQKQLLNFLCEPLKNRVSYFLTRYHTVHNAYGRAVILLDNKELVSFSWVEMQEQEENLSSLLRFYRKTKEENKKFPYENYEEAVKNLQSKWNENCIYCESDFLLAVTDFLQMPIIKALHNDNAIIRILAILDRRVGTRTLKKIKQENSYKNLPEWVRQFYELRFCVSNCI